MKRCTTCILTEKTPHIEFDEHGVCNYCKTHQKIEYHGEDNFIKILDQFRSPQKKYECIVPLSGGRDSSFVLLKLVKDYQMKVLAVNYNNPFTDSQAKKNIKNATEILGVDLITVNPKNDIHRRTYRGNLRTWTKKPSLGVVPMMCISCKTMWWEILKVARQQKINLIVSGNNRFEDTSYKKALLGIAADEKWENTFIKSFFGVLKETLKNIGYLKPAYMPTILKAYFFGDTYALGAKILSRKIKKLDLFYFRKWDENEIFSRIKDEIKWQSPENIHSSWRWDCQAAHLKDLIYLKAIGITEKDDFYAKMVREGVISREDALKRIELENQLPTDIIRRVLAEADFTYEEFETILEKNYGQPCSCNCKC
jgi:PP-loop superfamily ATP-utilizing enzyme